MVAFTRKLQSAPRTFIRKPGNQTKGIYRTVRSAVRSQPKNNSRKVKVMNNETRRIKKDKRKAKLWKAIVEEINDEDIRENIGLYVNEHGHLVSDEEHTVDQYDLLIEELENRLDANNDDFSQKVIHKAIKFVRKQRKAFLHNAEMNSLGEMMAGL